MCVDHNSGTGQTPGTVTQPNNLTDQEVIIEADEQDDASEIGTESVASSSTSVTSSILDYRIENGRTYHKYKDGKYNLPNDEAELERLDLQHTLFLLTFYDKLGNAPPNDPGSGVRRVLDVGTGIGAWSIDFGDEHPEAEVLGIDLSATQPLFTPPNVKFEIDDLEEPWTFSRPFDYIHSRMMNSCINDWKQYIDKCYENLTPGGWLEVNEIDVAPLSDDGTLKPEHSISRTVRLLQEASDIFGRAYQDVKQLKFMMMEAGFTDVTMRHFKWPTNSWPKEARHKELGVWHNENLSQGWEGICMAPLTRALEWTREEVIVLMAENRKDFADRNIHAYFSIWSIYGKKPEESEELDDLEPTRNAHLSPVKKRADSFFIPDGERENNMSHNINSTFASATIVADEESGQGRVAASILESRVENGRTYHKYKDGKYWAPNDEREKERLDLVHNLYLLTFDNNLGTAPPNQLDSGVRRVLDVGTGTGIWAIEFGEDHPEADVLGIDLSASQPEFVPPNVLFEIDDIEEPWTFTRPFDYIHSRMMKGSIRDWRTFLQRCFNNLSPGGYLELNDIDFFPHSDDNSIPEGSKLMKAFELCFEALEVLGSPFEEFGRFETLLAEVGFQDIQVHRFKWPTNTWPKHKKYKLLGEWNHENLSPNLDGLLMAPLTRALNMKPAEVYVYAMEARRELADRTIHAYFDVWSIHGRKPMWC
ncbi:methyltransferase domain-containing protein [Colletotrichum scovillei]|uniref:Methyltransferase domain-containing protein n=1 Tax=Colletotrichum scovillei TaxID=1209932 RepID=A0A9P7UCE1_9PEZI|nr:methyltransferase domain-containing protein [Colletotrichum scovillei]